jgi:hypothetical protein
MNICLFTRLSTFAYKEELSIKHTVGSSSSLGREVGSFPCCQEKKPRAPDQA